MTCVHSWKLIGSRKGAGHIFLTDQSHFGNGIRFASPEQISRLMENQIFDQTEDVTRPTRDTQLTSSR